MTDTTNTTSRRAETMAVINAQRNEAVRQERARVATHHLAHSRLKVPFAWAALEALEPPAGTLLHTALRRCTTALGRPVRGDADLVARAVAEALRLGRAKTFVREWMGER